LSAAVHPIRIAAMADHFDASAYLEANPDVASAIGEGRMRSAWSHYVHWGFRERRAGVPDAVRGLVRAVMEVPVATPPARLILRVHGTSDAPGFEQAGRIVALDIYTAVDAHLSLDRPMRILDFGCGCARVLRCMGRIAFLSTIYASDIDGEAIGWCRENYSDDVRRGRCRFTVNGDLPPVPFPSGFFDFVYAISVFTHLPEVLQLRWLGELRRVTRPGGILALSTQGDALIRKHLSPENCRLLDEKGFYYFPYGGTEGLPDYYQAAWHARSYIERTWSRFFNIVEQIPAGVAEHQDLILCRKPAPAVI